MKTSTSFLLLIVTTLATLFAVNEIPAVHNMANKYLKPPIKVDKGRQRQKQQKQRQERLERIAPPSPPKPKAPETGPYDIGRILIEEYLNYTELKEQLKNWNNEAPEITDVGSYGKTRAGTETAYLRMGTKGRPKVLIHAAIHGNERLSAAAIIGMVGKMLYDYKRDDKVTWLIKNRDIYFVPVLSPDTYLDERYVEGVDPNRDYPFPGRGGSYPKSSPIKLITAFHLKHKFKAVMSGHTFGRDFFWPSICSPKDEEFHKGLAEEMANIAGYDPSPVSEQPHGYEVDWYYWKGAVAMITEFGQSYSSGRWRRRWGYDHDQPVENIKPETEKTYRSFLLFIKRAPEYTVSPTDNVKKTGWVRDNE